MKISTQSIQQFIENRRSYYGFKNESPISNQEIEDILAFIIKHTPSPFNVQSARIVLLLGKQHQQLWDIVKNTLKRILSIEQFLKTEEKINHSFASGYGTILFFEDQDALKQLSEKFPSYKETFPVWSLQSSGMHQYLVWASLENIGFGASLQHYNPLIDDEVKKQWNLPSEWKLLSEMPFGMPLQNPGAKTFAPIEGRLKIFI